MQLQTYAKIGICVGIGVAVIFTIIGIVGASNEIQENWLLLTINKDKLMEKMKVLPSVILFAEKYPDHYYQENRNKHHTQLEMPAYDFDTGNNLRLEVNYDIWDERFREYVRCDIEDSKFRKSLGATKLCFLIPLYIVSLKINQTANFDPSLVLMNYQSSNCISSP